MPRPVPFLLPALAVAGLMLGLGAGALGVRAAGPDPILERQGIMKHFAATSKQAAAIAKGQAPFDAARAKALLAVYIEGGTRFPTLFPEDSKTGHDTQASPKIWEDMAGFHAAAQRIVDDATAAQAATDQASFAAAFGKIGGDCGACHKVYRLNRG